MCELGGYCEGSDYFNLYMYYQIYYCYYNYDMCFDGSYLEEYGSFNGELYTTQWYYDMCAVDGYCYGLGYYMLTMYYAIYYCQQKPDMCFGEYTYYYEYDYSYYSTTQWYGDDTTTQWYYEGDYSYDASSYTDWIYYTPYYYITCYFGGNCEGLDYSALLMYYYEYYCFMNPDMCYGDINDYFSSNDNTDIDIDVGNIGDTWYTWGMPQYYTQGD
jgi:hypothetical protein